MSDSYEFATHRPAPPADASRCPRGDRVGREPEGDVASPHEGSGVLGSVPDAIRCRVRRMHARLHIEIMTRLRSRWSTCRPLLAHRAESAHQRRGQADRFQGDGRQRQPDCRRQTSVHRHVRAPPRSRGRASAVRLSGQLSPAHGDAGSTLRALPARGTAGVPKLHHTVISWSTFTLWSTTSLTRSGGGKSSS